MVALTNEKAPPGFACIFEPRAICIVLPMLVPHAWQSLAYQLGKLRMLHGVYAPLTADMEVRVSMASGFVRTCCSREGTVGPMMQK